jgi:acetone carboxylase gamma subunit
MNLKQAIRELDDTLPDSVSFNVCVDAFAYAHDGKRDMKIRPQWKISLLPAKDGKDCEIFYSVQLDDCVYRAIESYAMPDPDTLDDVESALESIPTIYGEIEPQMSRAEYQGAK